MVEDISFTVICVWEHVSVSCHHKSYSNHVLEILLYLSLEEMDSKSIEYMKGMYRKNIRASSKLQHNRDWLESRGKLSKSFCEWNRRDGSRSCFNGARSCKISDFGGPLRIKVVPRHRVRNCSLTSQSTYQDVQDFSRKSLDISPFHYFILEFTLDELSFDCSTN